MAKHFINETGDIVREAIDGVLSVSSRLARLDGYPAIKVVVRTDRAKDQVAILSGGGAGHEPAHVGFVGRGMLTAAISGEIFASPSVDAVLAGILAVTGDAGALLVVKSYTGDRLNFGLAAERARALGKKVEIVIVSDDIALPDAPHPRGVAGTLFVHKVAGHFAERGADLAAVKAIAERTARSVVSLGISLSSCTVPGSRLDPRMTDREAELGLGIHGEPGIEKIALDQAHALVATMLARLAPHLPRLGKTSRFALLLNNLGGVPPIELAVIMDALAKSPLRDRIAHVVGPASLMTSLDMKGFSLSLLALDPEIEAALLSEVEPRAWPGVNPLAAPRLVALDPALAPKPFAPSSDPSRRRAIAAACAALVAIERDLDALDAKVGDGDTGRTFASAARAIAEKLDTLPLADDAALLDSLSQILSSVMGGSSGVLLSIMTAAAATARSSGASLPKSLAAGLSRMQDIGGAKAGDRTMIDALAPALAALDAGKSLGEAARSAREGANATAAMIARAGRSSYLRKDSLAGVVDPGASAIASVLEALAS